MNATLSHVSNRVLSLLAGSAAFAFTLLGFLLVGGINHQVAVSLFIGLFALAVVRLAAERPNSAQARAFTALVERLLAVRTGDLSSPAPPGVRAHMPELAAAVDGLFEQVRSNLHDVHAIAMYDPVTQLPNRVHFRREAERLLRSGGTAGAAALLFIDLDGFKEVNDRLGHAQGDQTLAMVANRLRVVGKAHSDPTSTPLIARLAGDEFTILLSGGQEEAESVARAALAALSEPFRIGEHVTYMGASIGIALAPEHGADLPTLMKAADTAMYRAKGAGRSQLCVFAPVFAEAARRQSETEQELARAIERRQLRLLFEPQLCLRSGIALGAEAVPVFEGADGERVAGIALTALAEPSTSIFDLDDWALSEVAAARLRWRANGIDQAISLRLSDRELERRDVAERVRGFLAAACLGEAHVDIELDEPALMRCPRQTRDELVGLAAHGIGIALSDFGSGLFRLARSSGAAVSRVVLAPELAGEVDSSDAARTVAAAAIHLAHGLGCTVVAKGVDRIEQLEVLRAIGCDAAQGPACGPAMSEDEFLRWVGARAVTARLARAS